MFPIESPKPLGFRAAPRFIRLPDARRARRFLVSLNVQVVADDSGTKGTGTHLVFGGLIAPAQFWAAFSTQWDDCLKEFPAISYFKLAEAATRSGEFSGMTAVGTREKLTALSDVMLNFQLLAMTVSVDLSDQQIDWDGGAPEWLLQKRKGRRSKKVKQATYAAVTTRHPYYEAWSMFVLNATFHLWDLGLREQFDFIPDEHKSLGPRTAAWYPTFRAAVPEPMRTIMPPSVYARDDKTFLPLQAADMVAGLERMEREDNSSLAWLKLRLARLYHERRTIHINAESYARDRAVYQALNSPLAPDAVDEIQRLMGFPIKGPDGEQEP